MASNPFNWIARKSASFALFSLGILIAVSAPALAGSDMPHWSYGGATNPTQWGRLGHDFALCEVGRDQSPIDIDDVVAGTPAEIVFDYNPVPLQVVNNGHTIQVNYAEGSTVSINGDEYNLLQFHFHTPSEHTTSGQAAAMELHLVHRNAAGELAVVGVMLEAGVAHPVIDTIWAHIPEEAETKAVEDVTINAADLLPGGVSYYSYAGSLTTPPCSEAVWWNILVEPIQVSEEQIAAFERLYPVNARPVQPTNGRIIELHLQ
ncbi:MAG: carbonic anhydrase family protein [Cyanobacteria bacterium P01_G01_bin.38]